MTAKELLQSIRSLGLTQVQIAEKTGIPQPTISKLERGDVQDVMSRNYVALVSLHTSLTSKRGRKKQVPQGDRLHSMDANT